jgi:hypothetical protein
MDSEGADALTLVYLGSTETLMGRDAFLPWNKMKHTEKGLATITKGLDMLGSKADLGASDMSIRQGVPSTILARAIAASTFTSLPDMFNHFERGYDLYLDLMVDEQFVSQRYEATSWVYFYAIQAALRAEDKGQAEQWLVEMTKRDSNNPMTVQAQALLAH